MSKIKKIFIANRGEICLRIAQSARAAGIETATLANPNNVPQYLASFIDDFIFDPMLSSQSYLKQDLLVELAKQHGCDAVHPGYGYLSENCDFADKVEKAGLIWIGPSGKSMKPMASKSLSREIGEKHGVPCLKAMKIDDVNNINESELKSFAESLGYPVLIKATMGGGGKGMRIVHKSDELVDAAQRASSEAINAFGDGEIIIEKYLETSRHIEVQILADAHGRVCAIGDRDCSVQRRHQKIIEEAPAPGLSDELRKNLHEAACKLASAVNYRSAGTVEFLLDWSPKHQKSASSFYFLEMNTRLRVEHPVTETCYGVDLVDWQIRIAQGERLPEEMESLPSQGHAVEFRIYAEDCDQNFLPAAGPIHLFLPGKGPGIRWDVGLDTVDLISAEYDPMIAKVIAFGQNRVEAFRKGLKSLESTVLIGGPTNLEFLQEICRDTKMTEQPVSSDYLSLYKENLLKSKNERRKDVWQAAGDRLLSAAGDLGNSGLPTALCSISEKTEQAFSTLSQSEESDIIITSQCRFLQNRKSANYARVLLNVQDRWRSAVITSSRVYNSKSVGFYMDGVNHHIVSEPLGLDRYAGNGVGNEHACVSPVPGKVVALKFSEGQSVDAHEVVVVLESMKMEFEVKADAPGTISRVLVEQGQQVESGAALIEWEKTDS